MRSVVTSDLGRYLNNSSRYRRSAGPSSVSCLMAAAVHVPVLLAEGEEHDGAGHPSHATGESQELALPRGSERPLSSGISAGGSSAPPRAWSRGWRVLVIAGLLLAMGVGAFVGMYSHFVWYDDEGHMLMLARHFLDGHRLYDEVFTSYGPGYFYFEYLVHGLLGAPLTHSVARLVAAALWVATTCACGALAWGATGRFSAFVMTCLGTFWWLSVLKNEPGHPQELLAFLLPLTLGAVIWGHSGGSAVLTGVIIGFINSTKLNVGVFTEIPVGLLLLACSAKDLGRIPATALKAVCVLGSVAFPFVLMKDGLDDPRIVRYALATAVTTGTVCLCAFRDDLDLDRPRLRLGLLIAVSTAATVTLLASTVLMGTSLDGLLDGMVRLGSRRLTAFTVRADFPLAAPIMCALSAVVCLFCLRFKGSRVIVSWLRLLFGLGTVMIALPNNLPHTFGSLPLLGFLAPWSWVTVIEDDSDDRIRLPATVSLAFLAAWQVQIAYPVAGSQLHLGTFLYLPLGVISLHKSAAGLSWLWPARMPAIQRIAARLVLAILALRFGQATFAWVQFYARNEPLRLPGTQWVRCPPEDVEWLRGIVDDLKGADCIFAIDGFNSLHFWTGIPPLTTAVVGHSLDLLPDWAIHQIEARLAEAEHPAIIYSAPLAPGVRQRKLSITGTYAEGRHFGPYTVFWRVPDR